MGVVIFGVYFGDKLSLLLEIINLVLVVVGVDLFEYIYYMFWIIVLSFIIVLIIFIFMGFNVGGLIEVGCIDEIVNLLE